MIPDTIYEYVIASFSTEGCFIWSGNLEQSQTHFWFNYNLKIINKLVYDF